MELENALGVVCRLRWCLDPILDDYSGRRNGNENTEPKSKLDLPCCEQKSIKEFTAPKSQPLGFLLRHALKLPRAKATGRDWRTDPRPHDSIAMLDRAYYERTNDGETKVPIFRRVVKVSKDRVFYKTGDGHAVRCCSRGTWCKLDADLVGRAVTDEEKALPRRLAT